MEMTRPAKPEVRRESGRREGEWEAEMRGCESLRAWALSYEVARSAVLLRQPILARAAGPRGRRRIGLTSSVSAPVVPAEPRVDWR